MAVLLAAPPATAQPQTPTPELITHTAFYAQVAGLIWIAAEIAILYVLTVANRLITQHHIADTFRFTRKERTRALYWTVTFIIVATAVILRQMGIQTPAQITAQAVSHPDTITYADIYMATRNFISLHQIIWATFVTVWIILEGAIVISGYHLYRQLAAMIRNGLRS